MIMKLRQGVNSLADVNLFSGAILFYEVSQILFVSVIPQPVTVCGLEFYSHTQSNILDEVF